MYIAKKVCLLTALRTLQTAEHLLHGMILARPYLPFAAISLIGGFVLGILLAKM